MKLELRRHKPLTPTTTLGSLYIDGKFECFTLEDEVRELPGVPVEKWKIHSKTAIPYGKYEVKITRSERFKKVLPLLINVPGFSGVRIHSGNTVADTEGCILVGQRLANNTTVLDSRKAMDALMPKLQTTEKIWITIT